MPSSLANANTTKNATASLNQAARTTSNSSPKNLNKRAFALRNRIKSLARLVGKPMTWAYGKVPAAVRSKIHAKISAMGDRASKSAAAIKSLHARIRNDLAARRNYGYGLLTPVPGTANESKRSNAYQRGRRHRAAIRGAPAAAYRRLFSRRTEEEMPISKSKATPGHNVPPNILNQHMAKHMGQPKNSQRWLQRWLQPFNTARRHGFVS